MIAVLQFDSASVAALERLLADGRLPNLAALRAKGRHVQLDTPAEDFAAGAFYTLYSGVELGDHGIFYPFQWDASAQRIRFATGFDAPPAVWERLAADGLRTLAIDPYESRPPGRALGDLVCGVGFADRVVLSRWSLPRRTGRRLARELGRGSDATEIFGRPDPDRLVSLHRILAEAPSRVARAAISLLGSESYDLAWITFAASHVAGHQFWDLSQLDQDALSAGQRRTLASALDDVYRAVDRALGEVVAALPAGSDVIVTSAVGMDVNTSRAELLPGMLDAVLHGRPGVDDGAGSIWRLRAALPPAWRAGVAGAMPDRLARALTARLELRGIDWNRTRAFAHPADNQGYVRLNLRGREREGIVEPSEADALLEEISAGLRSFRDVDGAPAVDDVRHAGRAYPGERADRLPDLVVRWSDRPSGALDLVHSKLFGTVRRAGHGSGRSGNHTAGDAWALLAPGRSAHAAIPGRAALSDVAATVCEIAGASREGLRGRPLLVPSQERSAGLNRSSAKPTAVAT